MYANKLDDLDEMDKSLERYKLPKLTVEEIDNVNRPITSKEIEFIIKKLHTKKSPDNISVEFYQTLKREVISIPHKLLQKTDQESTLPNSFYEASNNQTPKPDKDNTTKEYYRPISLMNMDTKFLNKILPNRVINI